MTTKAGERLLDHGREMYGSEWAATDMGIHVAAIEAEARAAVLAELRAKVVGLPYPSDDATGPVTWTDGWQDHEAAVLALIDEAGKP